MSSSSNDSHGVSQPSPILINITIKVMDFDNDDGMKSTSVKIATERKECEGVHFAATSKLSKIRIDVKTEHSLQMLAPVWSCRDGNIFQIVLQKF